MRASQGRNEAARAALEELTRNEALALEVLDLDVLDERSVDHAVQTALARAGHLDVVVNNAGIVTLGLAEAFTPEQYQQVFDVNVAGVVRVNRAVLPAMRQRRSGLIIHVSSAAGRLVVPGLGPYCASKFALEAVADAVVRLVEMPPSARPFRTVLSPPIAPSGATAARPMPSRFATWISVAPFIRGISAAHGRLVENDARAGLEQCGGAAKCRLEWNPARIELGVLGHVAGRTLKFRPFLCPGRRPGASRAQPSGAANAW